MRGQDYQRMSKSDLREGIMKISGNLDSVIILNQNLMRRVSMLERDIEGKERDLVMVYTQKNYLEKQVSDQKNIENENSQMKENIQDLQMKINSYRDSIAILKAQEQMLKNEFSLTSENLKRLSKSQYDSLKSVLNDLMDLDSALPDEENVWKADDFLNSYFTNSAPLNNNSFKMILRKVILEGRYIPKYRYSEKINEKDYAGFYRGKKAIDEDGYNNYDNQDYHFFQDIPEMIDADMLNYYTAIPNLRPQGDLLKNFRNYVDLISLEAFNSRLPTIEVLKNKLFTLKYPNRTEESFLFNARKITESTNNKRAFLQVELANEAVKNDGSDNTAQDMVWRVYVLGKECYVALSARQLRRLSIELIDALDGVQIRNIHNPNGEVTMAKDSDYSNGNYFTIGKGIYLSRKKDNFMENSYFMNPDALIYLFKLVKS